MRLRITGKPSGDVDGMSLDDLREGFVYEVGTTLGCYLLAQGWAEPLPDGDSSPVAPVTQIRFQVTRDNDAAPPPDVAADRAAQIDAPPARLPTPAPRPLHEMAEAADSSRRKRKLRR